jgi:hypothetical protein
MTLIQAWGDSLSLLKPKHLKLFLLVTLKSVVDTYKVLLKYWWWLFAIAILFYGTIFLQAGIITYIWANKIADYLLYDILLFATLVTARPSLEQKNGAYFRRYMIYYLPILIYYLPMILLTVFFLPFGLLPITVIISPLYIFTVLFFLDSSKKLKDFAVPFFRALKMVVYNLPLLIIVGVILYLPQYIFSCINISPLLIAGITIRQMHAILNIFSVLLVPIALIPYINIYIKKLHDQFDLYFKQPS